jgi:hypothetical protein
MNQEQFGQFWEQLKAPLQAKWDKITDEDLLEIQASSQRSPTFFRSVMGNCTRKR